MGKIEQAKRPVHTSVKDEQLIEKRRSQLIRGSVQLFKQKGFHRTTTREMAKAAGFSIGTLYEYIRTKEDVLYLVCDSIYEQVKKRLQQIDLERGTVENIKCSIRCYFQVMDEMQDEVFVMYQEAKSISKETIPYTLQKEEEVVKMFETLIQHCVDSGALNMTESCIHLTAQNIFVQGQMWGFRGGMLQKSFSLEQYIELQTDLLFSGVSGCSKTSALN